MDTEIVLDSCEFGLGLATALFSFPDNRVLLVKERETEQQMDSNLTF